MENKALSKGEVLSLDESMIQSIINDYFEFRSFFKSNTDYKDQTQISKKKELLKAKSLKFYEKFSNHPLVTDGPRAEEILKSQYNVFVSFKNGSFMYPKSFVRYIDRLQDFNTISIKPIDLTPMDEFMKAFPLEKGLFAFLQRFFDIVRNLVISLRPREVDLVKVYTNIRFLKEKINGSDRYYPPQPTEILKVFGLKQKSVLQVSRADNFLYNNRVCFPTLAIMNSAKYGFTFAAIDYPNDYPDLIKELIPYRFWDFKFKDFSTLLACVPLGNTDELLDQFNYILMDNWSWNLNFQHFNPSKYDTSKAWETFNVPNLTKRTRLVNYASWDIIPKRVEYNQNEIEIIRKLSSTNIMNLKSYDALSDKLSASGTREIVKKLVKNEVFQLYPGFNHINLQNYIMVRIETRDKELFENIVANLLTLPVAHIFSNKSEGLILSSINVPKESISDLVFELKGLKSLYEDIKVEIANLLDPFFVSQILSLKDIDFSVKNGTATLN
jgi:hypothetical protein